MNEAIDGLKRRARGVRVLAYVNVGIWAIAMIAMVALMRHAPGVGKLYPLLAGGTVVGIVQIVKSSKMCA